jgi:hypothetical protein
VDRDGNSINVIDAPFEIADNLQDYAVLFHGDDRGFVWVIDVDDGISRPVRLSSRRAFPSRDCTGRPWFLSSRAQPPPPRFTFQVDDGIILAIADGTPEATVSICSTINERELCERRSKCESFATASLEGSIPTPVLEVPAPRPAPLQCLGVGCPCQ